MVLRGGSEDCEPTPPSVVQTVCPCQPQPEEVALVVVAATVTVGQRLSTVKQWDCQGLAAET